MVWSKYPEDLSGFLRNFLPRIDIEISEKLGKTSSEREIIECSSAAVLQSCGQGPAHSNKW